MGLAASAPLAAVALLAAAPLLAAACRRLKAAADSPRRRVRAAGDVAACPMVIDIVPI